MKALLMKDTGLKMLSLIIALLLSFYVNSESNTSVIGFVVPVEIRNLPASKVIIAPLSRQVQVSIKGPSFLVSRIAASPPTFKVNVPSPADGRFKAALKSEDLALPPYVSVQSIEPSELEFFLDNLVEREVPVVVPKIGSVSEYYKLDSIEVRPDRVKVSGPESEIKSMLVLESEAIDLRGVKSTFERSLILREPGRLATVSVSQVFAVVKISSVQQEKKFANLPVEVRAVGGGAFRVAPAKVTIEISGPREAVKDVKPESLVPYIRVQAEDQLPREMNIMVDLPDAVSLVSTDPEFVRVSRNSGAPIKTLQEKPSSGKK